MSVPNFFVMRRKVILLSSIIFLVIVPISLVPVHVFQIEALREGIILHLERVTPGFRFSLGFMHSVERCPVWDHMKVDDDYNMVTYATEFWSSRTGLPYAAFGNETFRAEGDHFIIENMHRIIPSVDQWVNTKYDNSLRFEDGREIKLPSLAGDTLLRITIERIRLGYYLYHMSNQSIR
ncbi:MAG: DUF1850 domain-containing protein [Deltaproteobacteria bacterium]|nr:DUF1850 domain-containing protein [Deltaproteobacteria bacterium]